MSSRSWMHRALVEEQNRDEYGRWIPGKKPVTGNRSASSSADKGKQKMKAPAQDKGKALHKAACKAAEKEGAEKAREILKHMTFWELHNAVAMSQDNVKALENKLEKFWNKQKAMGIWKFEIEELEVDLAFEKGMKSELHRGLKRVAGGPSI